MKQEVKKGCLLSGLTNSGLVYEPKFGGMGLRGLQCLQLCTWSPNIFLRSNFILNICYEVKEFEVVKGDLFITDK